MGRFIGEQILVVMLSWEIGAAGGTSGEDAHFCFWVFVPLNLIQNALPSVAQIVTCGGSK